MQKYEKYTLGAFTFVADALKYVTKAYIPLLMNKLLYFIL
jgi:hypothetical protein